MSNRQKIVSIIFLVVLLFFFCGSFVIAERPLEIEYPEIGGEAPTEETKLPEYIKYIFNFSLILGAILSFSVLLFGGIRWFLSAGSPAAIGEAKSWILAGIIGLTLLLSSYLILTTINPELVIFGEMKPLEPVTGVYLCENMADCATDDPDKRRYYASSTPVIKDFDARWIKFISSAEELSSVFVYKKEHYQADAEGDIIEIKNEGIPLHPILGFVLGPKSIDFFWNKPGVYLYEKTDFGIDKRPPKYLSSSTANLGDWNNKVQSIKIKKPTDSQIGTILFTESEYRGECDIVHQRDVSILNESTGIYSVVNNTLSSIAVYYYREDQEITGDVVFYNSIECEGAKKEYPIEETLSPYYFNSGGHEFDNGDPMDGKIISFKITGPAKVLLTTQEPLPPSFKSGKCQLFTKPLITDCIPTVKGSYIYDPEPDGDKVRSATIIPGE